MTIKGAEGLTTEQLRSELARGGRVICFDYCVSFLVITFRRSSEPHLVRSGENAVAAGLPYTLLTLVLGWWGFPFGIIYTCTTLWTNLGGGRDVTAQLDL